MNSEFQMPNVAHFDKHRGLDDKHNTLQNSCDKNPSHKINVKNYYKDDDQIEKIVGFI